MVAPLRQNTMTYHISLTGFENKGKQVQRSMRSYLAGKAKDSGLQLRGVGVVGEQGDGGARPQENPGGSQGMRSQYERRELNTLAEIGLEELNELEMEIMRRQKSLVHQLALVSLQLFMITERLRYLEDQSATWHQREVLLFTMLLSSCIANLWLWMRQ
ncbi:hypothetical protein MJG53_019948 [Ovis ammon polii x Ovis aries]|uniref:Fetal and adult testis-expressed transcript protein n=2 Tax=Ovis TaxID=9935 RepID=A0A835ZIU2_SHEEP|nr:hypothetical protein JEQ12_020264 [Ovis aries]KAI4554649.1 hypothetical protein MJG53_019948 [Ovis ammon polii x Ovis aries]